MAVLSREGRKRAATLRKFCDQCLFADEPLDLNTALFVLSWMPLQNTARAKEGEGNREGKGGVGEGAKGNRREELLLGLEEMQYLFRDKPKPTLGSRLSKVFKKPICPVTIFSSSGMLWHGQSPPLCPVATVISLFLNAHGG
ncbi:hypothetical protein NQZ68_039727, partial [Dissostichus eleginoides]